MERREMLTKLPFNIFQYSSHLEFLQDAYEYLHAKDESFSYDRIAEACGLKSRTHARNLIKGMQDGTEAQLSQLGECLGLESAEEKKYLFCLQQFQRAATSSAAYTLFQQLIEIQKKKSPAANPFREIEIATSVLHMTLLSVLDLEGRGDHSPAAISKLLKHRYTESAILAALADLVQHQFIASNPATGRFQLLQKHIRKYDYNSNFFLKRFHAECLDVAREALENEATSERYLVGASFSINSKVFPRIIQKMNAFIENLMQLEGVAGGSDTVVQVNTQLIKMTTVPEHAKGERGLGRNATERELAQTENTVIA